MKKSKRLVALFAVLVMVFSAVAGMAQAEVLDNGRLAQFTLGMANDPQELAPWNPNNSGKNLVWHQIYECLFDNDGADYVPVLAKGYTKVDDTTYDVEIYDYIHDSEGNAITADDVVYSYQVLVDSGYGIKYDVFESVEKIDDTTVRFHFSVDPFVSIGTLEFIWGATAIFSKTAYENGNFATAPVATGPYAVADYKSGSKLILEANDNYWQTEELTPDTHKRTVQTIEYDIIAEAASQTVALKTNAIQYSTMFDMASLPDFQADDNYVVSESEGNFVYSLVSNCYEGRVLSNEDLRKAIYYAVDNTQIAAAVSGFKPAVGAGTAIFADYDEAWADEENYMTVYDLDLAKEYMSKAGYNGEEIILITMNDENMKKMATICQAMLSMAGFNIKLQINDQNTVQTVTHGTEDWDIYLCYCASGGFCISLDQAYFDDTINGNGMTMGMYVDDELQSLYELCNTMEGNTAENMKKLRDVWIGKAYIDPLVVNVNYAIYSSILTDPCYDNNLNFVPGGSAYQGQ